MAQRIAHLSHLGRSAGSMNRFSASLLLALLAAGGAGIYLGVRLVRGPDSSLLLSEGGAEWVKHGAPERPKAYNQRPRQTLFEHSFTLSELPQRARLVVRSFRSQRVFVNGNSLGDAEEIDLTPHLKEGLNRLRVAVENDRGPPALLAYSADLDLATPRDWSASVDDAGWSRAEPVGKHVPFSLSRKFPTASESLQGKRFYLLAFLLLGAAGSLLLSRYAAAHRVRWLLLGAWVVLCANNLPKIPLHVGFDAPAHYDYIRFILQQGKLPLATDGWEMFQAPLFYLLAALSWWIGSIWLEPEPIMKILRILPMLCGLVQIEIVFRSCRVVFPRRNDLQIVGTVVGGFLPMNLYMSQVVGNEPLAGCLVALTILYAFRWLSRPEATSLPRGALGLGSLFGLALLAKVSGLVLLPLFVLLIIYLSAVRGTRLAEAGVATAGFLVSSALVSGWFYVRNWIYLGHPIVGSGGPSGELGWWQAPGYRVPSDLLRFGEALTYPIYSALMGFWDGLYSTFWLDGFLSGVWSKTVGPPWNHEFMLSMALLSLPLALAGIVGILSAIRPSTTPARLLALGCVGAYFVALVTRFFTFPAYSNFKTTHTLGLMPCYAVLITSGFEHLLRGPITRAIASAYLFAWLAMGYLAYFVY